MPQMTVLEILNRTKVFFEKKGVPDARLDAEYIISHGLGMKNRMDLYLNFEKPLTAAELDTLRPLVARRANREPLQHIVGDTSFRGHIIKCDPRALIPRPETESLVDMAIERLNGVESPFIVEVGTGTAAISIACAKEIAGAKVLATDISDEALSLARENAQANGLNEELTFAQGDLLDAVTGDIVAKIVGASAGSAGSPTLSATLPKISCLIANLPYIPDGEKGKLQPEVDKFDPALALYGGPDGLDLVRKLLQQTEGKLSAGAPVLLEIGSEQAEVLKNEADNYPWLEFEGIHKDYCGNIRFVSYRAK
ncbi:peptide chain release factor N(5)-glutamine methyltransferase [uncultured Fibrobacter sp.]|uniref:peptide chain release factor N(5)-glutamine methyltransferase n=1 Tax=uncultured Fibrobacter sp. TaxID=261512 RepID=UPI0025FA1C54|nr:peptide chain release factor N(5)-glutamine methyltransferase [uncultured Fibrobacter sp.]